MQHTNPWFFQFFGKFATAMAVVVFAALANAEPIFEERTADHLDLNGTPTSDSNVKKLGLGDFNNDGREDIAVARRGDDPLLLINVDGVLTELSSLMANLNLASNAYDVLSIDVNDDGWEDLVFGRRFQKPSVYFNLGESTGGVWLGFDGGTAIDAGANNSTMVEGGDLDGDNDIDLVTITSGGSRRILINNGSGSFSDETSARLGSNVLNGIGKIQIGDVDGDDDIDIIAVFGSENQQKIYYNNGSGSFPNSSEQELNLANLTYMPVGADFNGDGIFDYRVYADGFSPTAFMSMGTFSGGFPDYMRRFDADMIGDNGKHGFAHIRDVDGDGDPDYIMSSIEMLGTGLNPDPRNELNEMVITAGVFSGDFDVFADPEWRTEESYDVLFVDVNLDGNIDLFIAHEGRYAIYINDAPPNSVVLSGIIPTIMQAGIEGTMQITFEGGVNPEFNWSLSDGTKEFTGTETKLDHTFAEPGRYQITVTLTDSAGSDQITFWQNVHAPLSANKPRSSTTILYQELTAADDQVWTVNTDNNSVTAINAFDTSFIQEIAVGLAPATLAQVGDDRIWVVNKGDHTISIIDTDANQVIQTIDLAYGAAPHGIVVTNDGSTAFVTEENAGRAIRIDVATAEITGSISLAGLPRHIALSADNATLYVSRFITAPVPGESTRTVSTSGGGEVMLVETNSMSQTSTIMLPYNDVIDTQDSSRGVPNYVMATALSPDSGIGVVPANVSNIYRGVFRDGNAREHDRLVRSMLGRINVSSQQENISMRFDFDDNSQPTAAVFGPNGNHLYVVHEGSRSLHVLDAYANQIIVTRTAGKAPRGIAVSPDGRNIYINNFLDRTVSVFDTSNLMDGIVNAAEEVSSVDTVVTEILNPFILQGKQLFFDAFDSRLSSQAYISCATCHDDAGHDGRVWDFSDGGEGLRNTIDLRGRAGIGHGNVHWTANFDEIHDFENDIRGVFDGTGLMTNADFDATSDTLGAPKFGLSADLDALAAYTATLTDLGDSPYRQNDGALTVDGQAGQAIFASANCASCHTGSTFTDSPVGGLFHDIGTVDADTGERLGQPLPNGGLDTPTLRGLWHGAPYLHDGSAATVEEAILAHTNVATVGFDVTQLNTQEIDQLADYVLQIDDSELSAPAADTDNDGVVDFLDNCSAIANAGQLDTNGDGFGNACDADINNDCNTNFLDLVQVQNQFLQTGVLDADFNGDGVVNFIDVSIFAGLFLTAPGPSGVTNACSTL